MSVLLCPLDFFPVSVAWFILGLDRANVPRLVYVSVTLSANVSVARLAYSRFRLCECH